MEDSDDSVSDDEKGKATHNANESEGEVEIVNFIPASPKAQPSDEFNGDVNVSSTSVQQEGINIEMANSFLQPSGSTVDIVQPEPSMESERENLSSPETPTTPSNQHPLPPMPTVPPQVAIIPPTPMTSQNQTVRIDVSIQPTAPAVPSDLKSENIDNEKTDADNAMPINLSVQSVNNVPNETMSSGQESVTTMVVGGEEAQPTGVQNATSISSSSDANMLKPVKVKLPFHKRSPSPGTRRSPRIHPSDIA